MPRLLLKFNAAVIKEIPIDKTPLTIGRKSDNDVVIDNLAVSGHHAKITLQGTNYMIEDLNSTNGLFVNEKRTLNSGLKHNDSITIGQHQLVFLYPESQVNIAPADSEATVILTRPPAPADVPPPPTPQSAATTVPDLPKQEAKPEPKAAPKVEPKAEPKMEPKVEPKPAPAPIPAPAPAPAAAKPPEEAPKNKTITLEYVGVLRVIEGKSNLPEFTLGASPTYVGKSENAAIRLKGFLAPQMAALISKRQNGFAITPIDGTTKINSIQISGQTEFQDGDVIEVGGLKLLFQLREIKPEKPETK